VLFLLLLLLLLLLLYFKCYEVLYLLSYIFLYARFVKANQEVFFFFFIPFAPFLLLLGHRNTELPVMVTNKKNNVYFCVDRI